MPGAGIGAHKAAATTLPHRQRHASTSLSLPLTRAGPLRLLEAARLFLERLGEAEEAMNLAESALGLIFGCVGSIGQP